MHFYNFPKPFKESDYEEVCDLAVNDLKKNPNIKSIYLAGGKWVPGISDLDILVVYNDKIEDGASILAPWSLSAKARYVFLHNYGSYNEQNFRNLYYLIPDNNHVRLLWGKEIAIRSPQNELSFKDYQFLNAVAIFDLLIKKLLFCPRNLMVREINVRRLLGELHSLVYTLEMMKIVSAEGESSDYAVKIKQLRDDWFKGDPEKNLKELMSLLGESIDLISKTLIKLNNFIERQSLPSDSNLIFKNRKYYIIFDKEWSQEKFIQNFIAGYLTIRKPFSRRIIENFKLVLPSHLSYFLMAWADYQGPLSDWIRGGLLHYQKPSFLSIPEGMKKRIVGANELVQASIANGGLFKIPYPYGLLIGKRTMMSKIGEKLILSLRSIKK